MDPLSVTAGVVSLLGACLKVSVELKRFRNAVSEGRATLTAMLVDVSALRQVLQSMEEMFDQLDVEDITTGHIGAHWQNLVKSLHDGHVPLEQLEKLIQSCNKEVAVFDQARRAIRLKEAMDSITELRQQIQSYKDTLQLSLQTVILWSCLSVQASTVQMLPNLAAIQADIRRLATNLDIKLQIMQGLSKASDMETQIRSVTNLRDCVRSAATVVSSASTIASIPEQDPFQDLNDLTSDIGSIWVQPEVSDATRSWVFQQTINNPGENRSKESLTTIKDISNGEDPEQSNVASNTTASENNDQGPSDQSLEDLATRNKPESSVVAPVAGTSHRWLLRPGEPTSPRSIRRSVAQLLGMKLLSGRNQQTDGAASQMENQPETSVSRKVVFVGDAGWGKSALLWRLIKGCMIPFNYPTVFEDYSTPFRNGEFEHQIYLFDTSGSEDYDRLRPLSYPNTDVVCICFAIGFPASLENVEEKWINEILHFCPSSSIFLLGLNQDVRDEKMIDSISGKVQETVNPWHAEQVRKRIGAIAYLESSAKTGFGVQNTFETIFKHAVARPNKPLKPQQSRTRNSLRA